MYNDRGFHLLIFYYVPGIVSNTDEFIQFPRQPYKATNYIRTADVRIQT